MAGYYVYWGTSESGESTAYQIENAIENTYTPTTPVSVSGIYYLRLQTQDNAGNRSLWQTLYTFLYDAQSPSATLYLPAQAGLLFQVAWGGEDAHSGVASYDLQTCTALDCLEENSLHWSDYLVATPQGEVEYVGSQGEAVYFRVRARDLLGNQSEWQVGGPVAIEAVTQYYQFNGQPVAMKQGEQVSYLHTDHLGSVSLITDAGGNPTYQARYAPYGQLRWSEQGSPTDKSYTGQRSEVSLGLMDYQARLYSPSLGRFISPDSLIPDPGDPLAWDRFGYVYNNPIRNIDPSGNTPWDVVDIVFFLLSVNDFAYNPTWGNAGWLLLDTVGLAPVVPSVSGYVRRGAQAIGLYDEVVQFAAKYGTTVHDFVKIAHKRGATTLMEKFLQATTHNARKGAGFELEYALKNTEDIVEIGRKLPGNSEIDFVLKGDIFVNVKNYDWTNPFYSQRIMGGLTGLDLEIKNLLKQAHSYQQYSKGVKYVFKGAVPEKVRNALETAGIVVEIIP